MAAPKRTPFERERDLELITSLYLTGKTQQAIADVIGVCRQQVGFDIQTIKRRWRESSLINVGEAKNRELDRVDRLEQEYWIAWENSLGERTRTKQETTADGSFKDDEDKKKKNKKQVRATVEKEQMLGNPAYLAGIQSCIEDRCKIIGLYAPTKIAPTTPEGDKQYDGGITEAERMARIAALFQTARDRQAGQAFTGDTE